MESWLRQSIVQMSLLLFVKVLQTWKTNLWQSEVLTFLFPKKFSAWHDYVNVKQQSCNINVTSEANEIQFLTILCPKMLV